MFVCVCVKEKKERIKIGAADVIFAAGVARRPPILPVLCFCLYIKNTQKKHCTDIKKEMDEDYWVFVPVCVSVYVCIKEDTVSFLAPNSEISTLHRFRNSPPESREVPYQIWLGLHHDQIRNTYTQMNENHTKKAAGI